MQLRQYGEVSNQIIIASLSEQSINEIKKVAETSTQWSIDVATLLFSSITFICILAYFFKKVD